MRTHLSRPILALALVFGLFGAVEGRASASPALQDEFTILVIGFVDVFGASDPACPACNGEYETEDDDYAVLNPLPSFELVLRDSSSTEIDRQTTSPVAGYQVYSFMVPEIVSGESYTVELVGDPPGWQLCFTDAPSRTVTVDDFVINNARVEYRFYQGCDAVPPTAAVPTATLEPGQPTHTPDTSRPTNTPRPSGGGGGGDREPGERFVNRLGSIRGIAFIDLNANGVFEAGEPGLNDVGVNLRGGGHEMFQITGPTGVHSWDGIGTGEYDLFIEPGPEWKITTPAKYKVKINGGVLTGFDFGLIRFTDLPVGKPAAPAKPVYTAPKYDHGGLRLLPSTGVADLPMTPLMGILALVLGGLAVAGWSYERRNHLR